MNRNYLNFVKTDIYWVSARNCLISPSIADKDPSYVCIHRKTDLTDLSQRDKRYREPNNKNE